MEIHELAPEPVEEFVRWFGMARRAPSVVLPEAACLCLIAPDGYPEGRMMLVKDFTAEGFSFYTNSRSWKGKALAQNPRAGLNFHWKELSRQVRVVGDVTELPAPVADAYFATRPRDSQIGAWASSQSEPLGSREELMSAVAKYEKLYEGRDVPRPDHWMGFLLRPIRIEFWLERPHRLHDRFRYTRAGSGWRIERLAP